MQMAERNEAGGRIKEHLSGVGTTASFETGEKNPYTSQIGRFSWYFSSTNRELAFSHVT